MIKILITIPNIDGKKLIQMSVLFTGIFFSIVVRAAVIPCAVLPDDTMVTSAKQQAVAYLDTIKELAPSIYWPNVKPALFLENIKSNINNPISIYPGSATNFCGYGALSFLFLQDDPLGYAKLLLNLYKYGKASFSNITFNPSKAVRKAAGTLRYKGILDIHPAEQLWFLSLADHYKGYLNFFDHKYDPGDENKFWAAVNYAKFNRMVRSLLHYNVKARGMDLMRPRFTDPYEYISEKLKSGTVVLFINNRIVHKKNHNLKLAVPTHFIVAEKISKENDIISFVYWDYGAKTLMQLSTAFFKRIIFGISYCTKTATNAR